MPASAIANLSPRVAKALWQLTQPPPVKTFVVKSKNYYRLTEEMIANHFSKFGVVREARIIKVSCRSF